MATEETSLTDSKVMRRGLLTGLAGLAAAAMFKLTGTDKAEAVHQPEDLGLGLLTNTTALETRLIVNPAPSGAPGLQVLYGTTSTGGAGTVAAVVGHSIVSNVAGVLGEHIPSGAGTSIGVKGFSTSATGIGVEGTCGGGNGIGVHGFANGGGGTGVLAEGNGSGIGLGNGVKAVCIQGGAGVKGLSNSSTFSADGDGSGIGVHGKSGSGKGVFGQSTTGDGAHGSSSNGVGLRGTSQNFVGLVGISDNNIGLYGYTVAPNTPALYAEHLGSSGRIAANFVGDVRVQGNFTVLPGFAKNAAVTMPDGSDAVLYCQESPEPYFEDFGRSSLINGVAQVQIEREFASLIKRDDYMVFITPGGESKGHLYVSRQTIGGFEVREAGGGTSNVPFSYRIVAKRTDIESKRLARLDPGLKHNLARMRADAATKQKGPRARLATSGNPLVPLDD